MTTFVLDVSVAAKWVLPPAGEPLVEEAIELLARYAAGELHFIVPDLFWPELGNILWKAVRQGRCARVAAETAIKEMLGRKLPTLPSADFLEEAFAIAATFDRTVYDSLYVAVAMSRRVSLLTADERLANALGGRLPVQWLGSVC